MIIPGVKSNLKTLMVQKGVVRRQVVDDTGLSSATITKIHQHRNVNLISLIQLCRYFGVSLDQLITVVSNSDSNEN